jgi:hemoglobin-like flavoprotein
MACLLLEDLAAHLRCRKKARPMTPRQIKLVQDSWEKVVPIEAHAAALFYNRLFTTDPKLRELFKGDLGEQKRKLMTMIGVAVNGLTNLEALVPAVQDLGRRHAAYGVQAKDYETVGSALLWTLEQGLGATFTPEVKEAWAMAYSVLAATMQQGATAAVAA